MGAADLFAGRYRVIRALGRGGFGVVYEAEAAASPGSRVALKVFSPLDPGAAADPKLELRFLREIRNAQRLSCPHVVRVFDFGRAEDGKLFLAMELCRGPSLRTLQSRTWLEVDRAVRLTTHVLRGLAAAHALSMVHRDIKPDNVHVEVDAAGHEIAKVLDFGLAKIVTGRRSQDLTVQGQVLGTLAYIAPEQLFGRPIDGRADLFSTGVMLFEMLSGRLPFWANSTSGLVRAYLRDRPPSLFLGTRGRVSPQLDAALQRALATKPELRFGSGEEMIAALLAAAPGAAYPARPTEHWTHSYAVGVPAVAPTVSLFSPTRVLARPPGWAPGGAGAPGAAWVPPPAGGGGATVQGPPTAPMPGGPALAAPAPTAPMPADLAPAAPAPAGEASAGQPNPAQASAGPANPAEILEDTAADHPLPTGSHGADPQAERALGGRFVPHRLVYRSERGEVFQGVDLQSGQAAWIKLLAGHGAVPSTAMRRYLRGVNALARVQHRHVVRLLGGGMSSDGHPYFATEWLPGLPMRSFFSRGTVPLAEACGAVCQVLEGLAAVHRAGIVHRDVSPEHIVVVPTDRSAVVKVSGFGIARMVVGKDGTATAWGKPVGNYTYMSPEQHAGQRLDPRSDLYSAGVVLYEALVGEPLHSGQTPVELVRSVYSSPNPSLPVSVPVEVREQVDPILRRVLAPDRDRRFQSAEEMRSALLPLAGDQAEGDFEGLAKAR